ncbi:MAG: glycerophosphodiester phosphodiesterase [Rhizobiaceae bacterium]|nr:glycerophosphodiester phosphodiesterase [Rhizobiaceae bacterium]
MSGINMSLASENNMVVAHRGASGYLPEHTLAAKALAHGMGADYIEQDVVLSKDGIPVVLHDIYLGTVTDVEERFPDRKRENGRYYAIDFTLAEIKTLRVHERTKRGSDEVVFPNRFPLGKSSYRVPTLAEEIELIQGLNRTTGRNVGIFPEIKDPEFHQENGFDLSKIVIDLTASYGYDTKEQLMILQSFDWAETQRIRNDLGYKGQLVQLLAENGWGISPNTDFDMLKTKEGLIEVAKIADGIGPWINQLVTGIDSEGKPQLSNLAADAKSAGLTIIPYTARADALPKWADSFDMLLNTLFVTVGVDGIFTDFPDKAVANLKSSR